MHRTQIGRVIFWMTGALLSFCAMAISIRVLAQTLSIFEVLAVRSALGLVLLIPIGMYTGDLRRSIVPRRFHLHLIRNGMQYAAQYTWAWTLTLLPLATVFALEFTSPAWLLVLASIFLGERLTPSRVGVIVLGFIGVLIILRPGFESFHSTALLVLVAAFGFAASNIATKKLVATESTYSIVFWMNVIQLPIAFLAYDPHAFTRLALWQLPAVIGFGIVGLSAHYCLTNAFRAGDASVVFPLDFFRVPLIAAIGWWLYGEALDVPVFAGAALIVVGVVWNLRAEAQRPLARATA